MDPDHSNTWLNRLCTQNTCQSTIRMLLSLQSEYLSIYNQNQNAACQSTFRMHVNYQSTTDQNACHSESHGSAGMPPQSTIRMHVGLQSELIHVSLQSECRRSLESEAACQSTIRIHVRVRQSSRQQASE